MFKKLMATAVASVMIAGAAGTASAEDFRVPYGDLDLTRSEGVAELEARINRQATRFCRRAPGETGTLIRRNKACVAQSVAAALSAMPSTGSQTHAALTAAPAVASMAR